MPPFMALLRHYLEYVTTPGMLLTIMILVVPISLSVFAEEKLARRKSAKGIPGCRRLGLYSTSNLEDGKSDRASAAEKSMASVRGLFTYPIEGCVGVELAASEVGASGLRYDRSFCFAQRESESKKTASGDPAHVWRVISQQDCPKLAKLQIEIWLPDPKRPRSSVSSTESNGHVDKDGDLSKFKSQTRRRVRGRTPLRQFELGSNDDIRDWAAEGGCLLIRFRLQARLNIFGLAEETMTVPIPLDPTREVINSRKYRSERLSCSCQYYEAMDVSDSVNGRILGKLKRFLGVPDDFGIMSINHHELSRLDSTQRLTITNSAKSTGAGLFDATPLILVNVESVRAALKASSISTKLSADTLRAHRANVYITNCAAFDENRWRTIAAGRRIGRDEQGLFETEAEYRISAQTPEGPAILMAPLFERGILRVGDQIQITGNTCPDERK